MVLMAKSAKMSWSIVGPVLRFLHLVAMECVADVSAVLAL
jgi:hypothetical protein